ncbi:MAG: hypothetical protein HY791_32930 [Deltaproteobacteria bacterium]|nr:hypothetical protein [Deltaproteobacteria bacterium]
MRTPLVALLFTLLGSASADAQIGRELTPAEKRVIGERLARVINFAKDVEIADGDTIFVVHRLRVPSSSLPKEEGAYEGFVTSFHGPPGVNVDPRVDEFRLSRMGAQTEISFRYALWVTPGTGKGGLVKFQLSLVERQGIGNEVASSPTLFQNVKIVATKPTATDLAADFVGYRIYARLAVGRRSELAKNGVPVTLTEDGKLPPLLKATSDVYAQALEFDVWRRRMWVAERHLRVAVILPDRAIGASAKKLQSSLNVPDEQLKDLPDLTLVKEEPKDAKVTVKDKPKTIKRADGTEELVPLDEKEDTEKPPDPTRPDDKPVVVEKKEPEPTRIEDTFERKRETPIPFFPRPLVLDDPNIAHTLGVRVNYAEISALESAVAPAFFFFGQLGLTRDVGFELTVPMNLISVDVARTQTQAYLGNPLLAAKYRLHLPEIGGRRAAIAVRIRYAMPISPLHSIPPTELGAEDFSLQANFPDTYAFLLEKHDIGAGFSAAWGFDMFTFTTQAYLDYFLAVSGSRSQFSFPALSYGLGVDVRPFGEWIGAYAEARGTSFLAGPQRTEIFTYLGARARTGALEPALWVSLPLGSISTASTLQFGAEVRFAFDLQAVIVRGSGREIAPVQFLEDDRSKDSE